MCGDEDGSRRLFSCHERASRGHPGKTERDPCAPERVCIPHQLLQEGGLMTLNIWKASTLVLAGALALLVSSRGVQSSEACGLEDAADVDVSPMRFRAAFGLLERTQNQLADTNPGIHRTRALEHVAIAMSEVKKALAVQRPRPR